MGSIRQSRDERSQDRQNTRVQDRDLWLLEALAKMRFLATSQLARLGFSGSRWAAHKRLRKLLDAGLVRVWLRGLDQENVYSLDRTGAKALEAKDPDLELRVPRGLDGNLEHLLGINDVRISLALDLAAEDAELAWWRSDWELRSFGARALVPDALFLVRWPGEVERAFSLELDNNTKTPAGFLRKILRYAGARRRLAGALGVPDFTILVVGRDARSLERYREALGGAAFGSAVWFASLDEIRREGASAAIWRGAEIDERYSLQDLSSLPYGKDGRGGENRGNAARYARSDARTSYYEA